jgi:hypothetical protein
MSGVRDFINRRKLEKRISKLEDSNVKPIKTERLSANQQLLLIHYLGFLDKYEFPTNEKKYQLFHLLIDKNKQAVKDFITYRYGKDSKSFNEKDLRIIHVVLTECGLAEIADKVRLDLDKFK